MCQGGGLSFNSFPTWAPTLEDCYSSITAKGILSKASLQGLCKKRYNYLKNIAANRWKFGRRDCTAFYSRELTCANFLANSFGTLIDHILLDRVESRRKLHLVHQLQMDMGFSDTDLPLWMKSGYEVEKEYQHPKFLNISESRHLDNVLLLSNVHLKGGNQPKPSELMLDTLVPHIPLVSDHLMTYPLLDTDLPYHVNYAGLGWLLYQQKPSPDLEQYVAKYQRLESNQTCKQNPQYVTSFQKPK